MTEFNLGQKVWTYEIIHDKGPAKTVTFYVIEGFYAGKHESELIEEPKIKILIKVNNKPTLRKKITVEQKMVFASHLKAILAMRDDFFNNYYLGIVNKFGFT